MPTNIRAKLEARSVVVGVIGLGYVGLPLVHAFWQSGIRVIGFDIDPEKIRSLRAGRSYIKHFTDDLVGRMMASGQVDATDDFTRLADADAILICVPTPLGPSREPDLSYVIKTTESIAANMSPGSLVVLESTTYPGTTEEVVKPILESRGAKDFLLAFSPEREDPGSGIETRTIPKIVGGVDAESTAAATALYELAFTEIHPVSDAKTAEAVKITENIFRSVNIALVNELKLVYARMGIDIWDVIEAAKSKPFGFMPFYPGPGLGGHCIPIDPFYLSWRARNFGVDTRFIELAGQVNRAMPQHVVDVLTASLSGRFRKAINGAKILVIGVAYKKNIDDLRESPALEIMDILIGLGAEVAYFDPHCTQIPSTREHAGLKGMKSIAFDETNLSRFDAALIVTDHSGVDYEALTAWSKLVVDTRNATKRVTNARERIVPA